MNRLFLKKQITAALFIVILFVFSIFNIISNFSTLWSSFFGEKAQKETSITGYIKNVESAVNENIIGRYGFIETYGALHVILNKKEENNYEEVLDNDGVLYNTYFAEGLNGELDDVVRSVKKIRDISVDSGSHFFVTAMPDKFLTGITNMQDGYPYNNNNENLDYYLKSLNSSGIDTIDLRIPLLQSGEKEPQLFFKTDHHWNPQTAFKAYQYFVRSMEKTCSITLDPTGFYTDEKNYNFIQYPQQYLGSQGRKTGIIYSGLDDFTLVYPKFDTRVKFSIPSYGITTEGRVEDAMIDLSVLSSNKNLYEKDFYGMYMYGVSYPFGTVKNEYNPKGPKILFIRDSFSCTLLTYFAPLCGQMDVIWPEYYKDSIKDLIEKGGYDYVVMMLYPGNLTKTFCDFKY